jgi:thioredoxin-like negative regulator of GroEL
MSAPVNIAALRFVLERDPASPLFYELAMACSEAEGWEEAEKVLKAGLAFHPEHLEARVLLGLALARLGDLDGARGELESASEAIRRTSARLYPQLAAICEEKGETERGLGYLRLAAAHGALLPEDSERMGRLEGRLRQERGRRVSDEASALMEQGRAEAAAALLREALQEAPQNVDLRARLKEAEAEAVREREAGQVISVLQRWLHSIKEEAGH